MLSDLIAPERLGAGDPQALAALVAVAGWSVVAYCERAGAGEETARAVVLAFVTFRRRAIEAGDEAGSELEKLLLDSARDAVDEVRGDAPDADTAREAAEALARATPRPLTPRLASQLLRSLVDAAPVGGDPAAVRDAAERSYAEAYAAAAPAPAVPGEQAMAPASPLLERAAQGEEAEPAPATPPPIAEHVPQPRVAERAPEPPAAAPAPAAARRPPAQAAAAALAGWLRALSPLARAGVFAAALVLVLLFIAALPSDDEAGAPSATETVTQTVTVTVGAPARTTATTPSRPARAQVVRGRPRAPLTASGARYEVVPNADAAWAREVRGDNPRSGTNWFTVAVRTRNVSRADLVLRRLGYRLRTSRGAIIGPRFLEVAEGPRRAREGRLPTGQRASVHLGFEIPFAVRSATLAFEPGGLGEPTVLVPLARLR